MDELGRSLRSVPRTPGIAEVAIVPADQLDAFAARAVAEPTGPLGPTGRFQVTPSGGRPFYCLETASMSRSGVAPTVVGTDLCASSLGPALLESRDSGVSTYLPFGSGPSQGLILGTPVYAGATTPTSTIARRAAFLGWTGTEIDPGMILSAALVNHPDTQVTFTYRNSQSRVRFTSGTAPTSGQMLRIGLDNGWTIRVVGASTEGGILTDGGSLVILLAGIAISVLLGLLIQSLSSSRVRAVLTAVKRTDQLNHQAFHDSLTGLPNRALILDRIDQMMARAHAEHIQVAGLIIDIDHFKEINDTLGHAVGDQVLVRVAARLSKALREGDTVGRLGGDEFIVLAEGASLAAGPDVVADRILDVMATPFQVPESPLPLTVNVSIGIASGYHHDAEELLRDADIALLQAKGMGRNQAVAFSSSMQHVADAHRTLDRDLRIALAEQQFFLMYQPTVHLDTGEFTGAEALLRWRHPIHGVIGPDAFVPALEATGLIVPVGQWVLEEACRQGARWHANGAPIAVSVNVASQQLSNDRILVDVRRALSESGFDPELLILELTETILMRDIEHTIGRLHLLKASGVRIAIDDFGTGYSSLAYLQQFPIDVLKIDQTFVAEMSESTESAAIVHTLVQLGKVLGLEVTAEGIETADQQARLTAEHVDTGQGYLFARPLAVDDVSKLLDIRHRQRDVVSASRPHGV